MTELSNASIELNAEKQSQALQIQDHDHWWRGAVIYQVYPRSFCDTNNDGIGDIKGVITKLDYIQSLGVDALWLSPFFKSPMKDFGYDISDYRDVDPIFGNLNDFDELVCECKKRGLRIMIDQVLSHTSDQHQWFLDSKQSQSNDKADWYVWADAKEDGSEPNNWLSIFGGSAWEWCEQRQQYYLHNFLKSQPDLNYHSPRLAEQMLHEMEFWLKRGVDGFRLDAINFCYHDQQLRDNPHKPIHERTGRGFSPDNPYASQYHLYDNTQDENLALLERIRNLLDQYPGSVALGEINSENSLLTLAEYTQGEDRLHMGYNFELLADEFSPEHIKNTVNELEGVINSGWPCWAVSNHDVTRVVSRWGTGTNELAFSKMILAMAASLRGTLCVYQGEELGFTEANIEKHQLQDPFGIEFWPEFKGRDGCRTPIPWTNNTPSGDFSSTQPWLPVAPQHLANNVTTQTQDPDSALNFYKRFLSWRKTKPALVGGDIEFLEATPDLLVLKRSWQDHCLIAAFNLSENHGTWKPQQSLQVCDKSPRQALEFDNNLVQFGAFGFAYFNS